MYMRKQVENPLRFTAREYDPETGLYYYRARYYDPALARFISEDPIGLEGGINPYAYAGNDPVNFTDPFGLCVGVGSTGRGVHTVACPFHDRAEIPWGLQSAGAALERDWEAFQKMFRDMQAEVLRNAGSSEFWSDATLGGSSVCGHPNADPNRCVVAATFADWIGPGGASRGLVQATRATKAINLPGWRKISIDMEHITSGHMAGGSRVSPLKTLFPAGMSARAVERVVRQAYRNAGDKLASQGERVLLQGEYGGLTIQMWINRATKRIETAYPVW
ncbi:MAG TPA: RHS repeat-associated core domain-containing protein [Longimicrobiaceae bacterium]|nr:RHS repeat-associated core domain-containing protein [Longimicrobiaceae bacterium]